MGKIVINKPAYDNYETPVLIICFNRPQYLETQLEALRLVKPSTIYLACDGARIEHPSDEAKVNAVRQGFEQGFEQRVSRERGRLRASVEATEEM